MVEIEASIVQESRDRYLTYALSVVSSRAIPDVRDGLKPVQRRILYAMSKDLGLKPNKPPRKSASVVGLVLSHYHPHGDQACYEAMVRLAQDFSLRYPLVEGQGNFGSLDGDSAAAYRYTEARLRNIALEVLGEIDEKTVGFLDNFDATTKEPVVLPSKTPNLLVNGATGIAVGMATSIPPHNLKDVVRALLALSEDPDLSTPKLVSAIKGPDFPTSCDILNTKDQLNEIYRSGRGSIRMRGVWQEEEGTRGKKSIVITAIPYAINKSTLVEKIGTLIAERKVPQFVDIRDESTDKIRVVLDGSADANLEVGMAYICKNTPLECTFPVNLTVLAPIDSATGELEITPVGPKLVSLRQSLQYFLDFRDEVVRKRLIFEKENLLKRIHILEGFISIFDALDEAIAIVRKSDGRQDAAKKLQKRFVLTEIQAFSVVDLRIYHLSRTNIIELRSELKEKQKRVREIEDLLDDDEAITGIVRSELQELADKFGDKRRCKITGDGETLELNEEDFLVEEEAYSIVTKDGWIKRIRQTNDFTGTRIREGDELFRVFPSSTLDWIVFVTNKGYSYSLRVADFPSTGGFGTPVQKIFKFRDGERVVEAFSVSKEDLSSTDAEFPLFLVSSKGLASVLKLSNVDSIRRSGKKVSKVKDDDSLTVATPLIKGEVVVITSGGYGLRCATREIPVREQASQGVCLIQIKDGESVVGAVCSRSKSETITVFLEPPAKNKAFQWKDFPRGRRALRGKKIVKRGVAIGLDIEDDS